MSFQKLAIENWGQNYFFRLIFHFSESCRFPIVIHIILDGPITMGKRQLSDKGKIHLNKFWPQFSIANFLKDI